MAPGGIQWDQIEPVIAGLAKRLDYIEEHLVNLGRAAGYRYAPYSTQVPPEVVELARAGDRLEAIKRYRELTGAHMEQAKAIVLSL